MSAEYDAWAESLAAADDTDDTTPTRAEADDDARPWSRERWLATGSGYGDDGFDWEAERWRGWTS